MCKKTVIWAIAFSFVSTSAFADWQYTKWGMTTEEVITASGNKASKPTKPNTIKDGHIVNLLSAPYNTERFKFKADFWFGKKSRQLEMVKLDLIDLDQCPSLIGELKGIYGTGEFKKLSFGDSYKWRDQENKNNIYLLDVPNGFCNLDYQSIVKPGSKGL
jgi:hypothetical protein